MHPSLPLRGTDVSAIDLSAAVPGAGLVLYSPLGGGLIRIHPGDYDPAAGTLADKEEYRRVLDLPAQHVDRFAGQAPEDLVRMSLIPTFGCNFSCVYCYSANGRNPKTMSREVMEQGLEYFFSAARSTRTDRYVSIVGGGEPLVAWEAVTRPAIMKIRDLERRNGLEVQLGLTTNGSLLTDAIAACLVENRVRVSFSFEVLPDVQNIHRKHYGTVSRNIHRLHQLGGTPALRMTVTPCNVARLKESVQECAATFPFVAALNMEYVIHPDFFADTAALDAFLDTYTDSFFEARQCGMELGLRVNTSLFRNMSVLSDRFCSGDFCLTPDGFISGCHRFTSPAETHFEDVVYGRVDAAGVQLDAARFSRLMSYNVHHDPRCNSCPAKWHCGGPCLSCRFSYGDAFNEAICRFKRRFLARHLYETLRRQDASGPTLPS